MSLLIQYCPKSFFADRTLLGIYLRPRTLSEISLHCSSHLTMMKLSISLPSYWLLLSTNPLSLVFVGSYMTLLCNLFICMVIVNCTLIGQALLLKLYQPLFYFAEPLSAVLLFHQNTICLPPILPKTLSA